jgi:hypothetical protein
MSNGFFTMVISQLKPHIPPYNYTWPTNYAQYTVQFIRVYLVESGEHALKKRGIVTQRT